MNHNQLIRSNVRVIAATNRDLKAAITTGAFRSDLFYRLNVFPIELPPLRERKDDIAILVEYFIDRYATAAGKQIKNISHKSMELLESYSWPGNVRELQNVIERSLILCDTETFSVDESWLPRERRHDLPAAEPPAEVVTERSKIEEALARTHGRVSGPLGAAVKLGISGDDHFFIEDRVCDRRRMVRDFFANLAKCRERDRQERRGSQRIRK